jgi:hypothetical protein
MVSGQKLTSTMFFGVLYAQRGLIEMTVKRKVLLSVSSLVFVCAILFNMVIAVGYVSGHSMLPRSMMVRSQWP